MNEHTLETRNRGDNWLTCWQLLRLLVDDISGGLRNAADGEGEGREPVHSVTQWELLDGPVHGCSENGFVMWVMMALLARMNDFPHFVGGVTKFGVRERERVGEDLS